MACSGQLYLDLGTLGVDLGYCVTLGTRMKRAESMAIRVIGNWLNTVVQKVGLTNLACTVRCGTKCYICIQRGSNL